MGERWFDDPPEHDPNDPEAVDRALRRQQRQTQRSDHPRSAGHGSGTGGRGRRRLALYGALGLFALLGVAFLVALFQPFAGGSDGQTVAIEVPAGAGVGEIGDLLADEGVISSSLLFQIRATVSGQRSSLYFGDHVFREGMTYSAALQELSNQPQKKVLTVVIPEGLSRSETVDTLDAAGLPGNYLKASVSSKLLDPDDYGAQGRAKNLEGFLFPATYELEPGSDVKDLVDQQLEAFKDNIAAVKFRYAKSKNLTIYDVLTIASMVEREVSIARERPTVAAVVYNRLSRGEPLYIDATTRFALDNWTEPLTESDLAVDSPYNTRTNAGLPPGPIGSPGLASIKAAAKPADTEVWLYVVKPGTCGEHVFSDSLEEHNANVARYQEAQEAADGSPTECP
ncbi:MAG: endolytic transglycosylase MltG [Solirubrobacterales bacterium]